MNMLQNARMLLGRTADGLRSLQTLPGSEPGRVWPPERLSLALQGGGSFGAFTWGVLDRLLEEPAIEIDAVSGASAGAVNGVLLASGLIEGGPAEARARLARFWTRMMSEAAFLPFANMQHLLAGTPAAILSRAFSAAQFNPFDLNPLRRALAEEINFEALQDRRCPRLLIATTRVRDGTLRIFRNDEITVDVVLASACLPLVHRTIEIDGEAYWDGAYVANPPILQLVHESDAKDLLVVQVTPSAGDRAPMNPSDIGRRLEQITFNSAFNAELAALDLARRLEATPKLRALRVGRLAAEDTFDGLSERSAADLGRVFIERLHLGGRDAAERWLAQDPRGLAKVA